jgi:hypothetical protein
MKKTSSWIVLALSALLIAGVATHRTLAADHAYIGAEKCKMCHKAQFDSWSASKHATQEPKVDCEGCHGPGSEYKSMTVMKDPAKAKAAGLIAKPAKATCTAKCHKAKFTDDMMQKVHAHKAKK